MSDLGLTQLLEEGPLPAKSGVGTDSQQEVLQQHCSLLKTIGTTSGQCEPRPFSSSCSEQPNYQTKAGLEGVDCTAVNKLIHSLSKNSEYFKTEQQRVETVKMKV